MAQTNKALKTGFLRFGAIENVRLFTELQTIAPETETSRPGPEEL